MGGCQQRHGAETPEALRLFAKQVAVDGAGDRDQYE